MDLVAEADADGASGAHHLAVGIHSLQPADGLGDVHGFDALIAQANHFAESALSDQVHRGHAESGCQDSVEGRGRAPALDVSQHADSHFFVSAGGDGVADQIADGAGTTVLLQLRWQMNAFRHHHDGEPFAITLAFGHVVADALYGEWNLRNQDDVGAAGDTRLQRDPTRIASHDFHHHDAVVRLGRSVNLVHRV